MNKKEFDIIIIGSGPAGLTAGIYAQRGGMKSIIIGGPAPGGQLLQTTEIENFPGFEKPISGYDLMSRMINQVKRLGAVFTTEFANEIKIIKPLEVKAGNSIYIAKAIIIGTGSTPRTLGIASEAIFSNKGVSYCATCDGFFYKGKDVCVIGGGDSACEEASFLTNFVNKVYLIHRRDVLRAAPLVQEKIKKNPKVEIIYNTVVKEIVGNDKVEKVILKNLKDNSEKELTVSGVFIAIGHNPNTELVKGKILIDNDGYIIVDSNYQTSVEGIFACGDVVDKIYKQAIIAASSGAIAAINAIKYIEKNF
ncbi:MAG: thioredoxin-disulfide reductase [Elusimicrobiales bacterium]|nr:thioredoxin-disulfide reductase [Elusimicrobiales bacterium]